MAFFKFRKGADEAPARDLLFQLGHLQNRVDRFLLGAVDEGAGVNHEHVRSACVGGHLMACYFRDTEQHF